MLTGQIKLKKNTQRKIIISIQAMILIAAMIVLLLVSCSKEPSGDLIVTLNDGKHQFLFYGKGENITYFEVKDGKKTISSFECNGHSPVVADMNFDGYADVRLSSNENKGYLQGYIYQPNVNKFTVNNVIGQLLDPEWDEETETVISRIYLKEMTTYDETDGPSSFKETKGEAKWKWIGGVLVQVSENGIEYFSDSEIFCCYTCTRVNGVCVRDSTSDKWYYSYEQLIAAGHSWTFGEE